MSPVWYVPAGYRQFFSVSSPDAKHSRNLAVRPQVAMVIFDSHRPGGWQAVYMTAVGQRVAHADVDEGVAVFTGRSEEQGPPPWTRGDVQAPAPHRLYRAIVSEHCVLDEHDRRRPVALG